MARPRAYAGTLVVGERLVTVSRNQGAFVLAAKPAFEQFAQSSRGDESVFNGTPAVSDGQLFLRSNRTRYCLQAAPEPECPASPPRDDSRLRG